MNRLTHSEKLLFKLIQNDQVNKFIEIYDSSEFIRKDAVNSERTSYLGESVKRSALKIAEFLLKEPDIINKLDGNKNKALSYIRMFGSLDHELIKLFHDYGLDFSKSVGPKGNMLHIIAPRGDINLFDDIISYGGDPHFVNDVGMIQLDVAKRWGNSVLIEHIERKYDCAEFDLAV